MTALNIDKVVKGLVIRREDEDDQVIFVPSGFKGRVIRIYESADGTLLCTYDMPGMTKEQASTIRSILEVS